MTVEQPERAAGYRIGVISLLGALIGILAGFIAYALYDLIGLFTNLAYYHEWSFHFRSPEHTLIGPWIIGTPVIGGLIVGVMAKYGSEKIKGHGIPEALEAVLTSRSRIEAKVAILKPFPPQSPSGLAVRLARKVPSFKREARSGRWWASSFRRRLPSAKCF